MGLRAASVRRSDASVMAPALTEANQSQNFKLTKSSHLEPASPVNGNPHHGGCLPLVEEHPMCKKSDSLSIIAASKPDGDESTVLLDNLNTFTAIQTEKSDCTAGETNKASESDRQSENVELIMSDCPQTKGEQDNAMGLQQKATTDVAFLLKDSRQATDMDQLMFTGFGNVTDLSSTSDLGQNMDELMQVIKSMETAGGPAPSDSGGETETIFHLAGGDIAIGLSSLEQDLLEDPELMCAPEQLADTVTEPSRDTDVDAQLSELKKDVYKIQRRYDFLLRRLSKLQAHGMGQHVSAEVAGLFEHTHRLLKHSKERAGAPDSLVKSEPVLTDPNETSLIDRKPATEVSCSVPDKPQGLGIASMRSLVHKLEKTKQLQSTACSRNKCPAGRYFGAGSVELPTSNASKSGCVQVPALEQGPKAELERVAGLLEAELNVVKYQVDSEATESSSGGESCDEMQNYNNPVQQYCTIAKRASWKWAQDRASVAARWTWLQFQISDLEFKIRMHNDLRVKLANTKGKVTLGSVNSQHYHSSPSSVNGYRGVLPGASPVMKSPGSSQQQQCGYSVNNGSVQSAGGGGSVSGVMSGQVAVNSGVACSRTLPLSRSRFRKRKLVQTTGLHTVSKKASRAATIRCGCTPQMVPCAVCTGRADPTRPREAADMITLAERISLLDPGYHAKVSLPEDVPQNIHFDAIMKLPEWQQKALRSTLKIPKSTLKAERVDKTDARLERRLKKPEHRRKYNRLLKTTATALSAKIKNKLVARGRKPRRGGISSAPTFMRINRKRHTAEVAMAQLQALSANTDLEHEVLENASLAIAPIVAYQPSSKNDSPVPSPQPGGAPSNREHYKRARLISSYDIDNIVIPYSVAASTRVERLQYKEIPTPKWRLVDADFATRYTSENNGLKNVTNEDNNDTEDISEEAERIRHDKCEVDEKRKFQSYIKFPLSVRSRANRGHRTDSRTESTSGANTPDLISPHPMGGSGNAGGLDDAGSPLTSPPATPLSADLLTDNAMNQSTGSLRRRTISQTRMFRDRDFLNDDQNSGDGEHTVPPYESRTFPLSDETYEGMIRAMPEGHRVHKDHPPPSSSLPLRLPESPTVSDESTLDSLLGEGEDPNDPEWMDSTECKDRVCKR